VDDQDHVDSNAALTAVTIIGPRVGGTFVTVTWFEIRAEEACKERQIAALISKQNVSKPLRANELIPRASRLLAVLGANV
jgi:hypothetical protein